MEKINDISKFNCGLIPINKNINGMVPIVDDKNIFLMLVIRVKMILTPNNIT